MLPILKLALLVKILVLSQVGKLVSLVLELMELP